jgi:hypothetical protein
MAELDTLIQRLTRSGVDFVVIGGMAAVAHGATLLTQDLDVCCAFSAENLLRLQGGLADLHPVHRMTPRRLPLKLTQESGADLKNLYLDTDLGQLDCLSAVTAVGDYTEVKRQSVEMELGGGVCRVLSLDPLIRSKEALNRPRDLQAVIQLKAIRERIGPE